MKNEILRHSSEDTPPIKKQLNILWPWAIPMSTWRLGFPSEKKWKLCPLPHSKAKTANWYQGIGSDPLTC